MNLIKAKQTKPTNQKIKIKNKTEKKKCKNRKMVSTTNCEISPPKLIPSELQQAVKLYLFEPVWAKLSDPGAPVGKDISSLPVDRSYTSSLEILRRCPLWQWWGLQVGKQAVM